jgi:hypothetical protein
MIASVAGVAHADGHMIPDAACRINTTQARTGVLTLLIDAGLVR